MVAKDEEQQTQGSTQESAVDAGEANVTPQSSTPITLHNGVTYLERTWREVPMYQCPQCHYNNTSLEDFANYQGRICPRPECPIQKRTARPMTAGVQMVDRFGNPVVVTERT